MSQLLIIFILIFGVTGYRAHANKQLEQAVTLLKDKKYGKVLKKLEKIKSMPGFLSGIPEEEIKSLLIGVYIEQGEWAKAGELCKEFISSDSPDRKIIGLLGNGDIYLHKKKYNHLLLELILQPQYLFLLEPKKAHCFLQKI